MHTIPEMSEGDFDVTRMLWTADYSAVWERRFAEIVGLKRAGFNVDGRSGEYLNEDELIDQLAGCDVFLVAYDQVTDRVLENCPDLKLILSVRDGPEENIDIGAATRRGVPVLNSAGRCTVSVAEFTFSLLLNMARPIITLNDAMHREGWTKENRQALRDVVTSRSTELCGKTLGVVGLGRNGQRLARYAQAFEMNVVAYDPFLPPAVATAQHIRLVELNELMSVSDYVSVLARVTPENHGLIGADQIALMKPTAAFVNTGRAVLVDTVALKAALQDDRIRMAAIDVFDTESLPKSDSYHEITPEKLILTNHTAGFSQERIAHQYTIALDNLTQFLTGAALANNCTRGIEQTDAYRNRGARLFGAGAQV